MTTPTAPREVVDLDALAAAIAGSLQDPTYAALEDIAPDGFVTFETTQTVVTNMLGRLRSTITATVSLVSDGENEVEGAAGQVFTITVEQAAR